MESGKVMDSEYGTLEFAGADVWYTYGGVRYRMTCHPYEPCLYLRNGEEYVVTLHNAFTTDELLEVFSAGGTLRAIDSTVYDEEAFCRVLATAIEKGLWNVDFTYAVKKAGER